MKFACNMNTIEKTLIVVLIAILGPAKAESGRQLPLRMPDVQPKVADAYLCTAYEMPKNDFEYIVGFTPNATNQAAHHVLVRSCDILDQGETDSPQPFWDCGEMLGKEPHIRQGPNCTGGYILYSWTKDAEPQKLPEGVGIKVGKDTGINYLILEVHYASVEYFLSGGTDNSGIILSLLPSSSKEVTKSAGVYMLFVWNGTIPARKEEHFEVGCRINEPNIVLHPFAFRTHTHALGKIVSGYKIDRDGKWHLIGKRNPQEPQMYYPVENKDMTIGYGDTVVARCTFYNFRNKDTYIGHKHEDEMCNFYMLYYVEGDKLMSEKHCHLTRTNSRDRDPLVGDTPQEINAEVSQLTNMPISLYSLLVF